MVQIPFITNTFGSDEKVETPDHFDPRSGVKLLFSVR